MPAIRDLSFAPLDVPLREPFGIATGTQYVARNVLVRLRLDDASEGLGEAAPFPAVNGETQERVLAALPAATEALAGMPVEDPRRVAAAAREALAGTPSALAAVETALLDALCRRERRSLWRYFGGSERTLFTDITIPTGDVERATAGALRAWDAGFRTLKIKIGGGELATDAARVRAVHDAAPEAALVLDANASLADTQALALLGELGPARARIAAFEQPTAADDLDGLRRVAELGGVPVLADESARSVDDVVRLARARAVQGVNLKIMKSGLFESCDMIHAARNHGLCLMIGGMVETELAMTTSACLAAGVGGFRFVDLDTPLFLGARPLVGGFAQNGPKLSLAEAGDGHGVRCSAPDFFCYPEGEGRS